MSNTIQVGFRIEALEEALHTHGAPHIFNADQGSQITHIAFAQQLKEAGVAISMDDLDRRLDNVFIERLWRSVKNECVYLQELLAGSQARQALGDWFILYNNPQPHPVFDGQRPMDVLLAGSFSSRGHAPCRGAAQETARQEEKRGDAAYSDTPDSSVCTPRKGPDCQEHFSPR